jgi:hypothetical protein
MSYNEDATTDVEEEDAVPIKGLETAEDQVKLHARSDGLCSSQLAANALNLESG